MNHTPLPWRTNEYGTVFCRNGAGFKDEVRVKGFSLSGGEEPSANTALIVRAVNNHQKLVDALKACDQAMSQIQGWSRVIVPAQATARALLAELEQK